MKKLRTMPNGYGIILTVCAVLVLILMLMILFTPGTDVNTVYSGPIGGSGLQENETARTVLRVENARAREMIAAALPSALGTQDLQVAFRGEGGEGILELSAAISAQGTLAYLRENGVRLKPVYSLAIGLLPAQVELQAAFALSPAQDGPGVSVVPQRIRIAQFDLDNEYIPPAFWQGIGKTITGALGLSQVRVRSVETENGALKITY